MHRLFILMAIFLMIIGCNKEQNKIKDINDSMIEKIIRPEEKSRLFNGLDLKNWTLFVPDSSIDVQEIWSVEDSVINCTGAVNGYIRTNNAYQNYKLSLEWRWSDEPGNSGVLLHMNGKDKVWPKCIEAQLMSGNAGDFYLIDGTTMIEQTDPTNRRVEKRTKSSEVLAGEWNRYEITCFEDSITLLVNGVLQNSASGTSVRSGKICLQSEGKPIQFRNIYIEPVN